MEAAAPTSAEFTRKPNDRIGVRPLLAVNADFACADRLYRGAMVRARLTVAISLFVARVTGAHHACILYDERSFYAGPIMLMAILLFPVAIACYLYGAIPFGYVFTYLASGKRIYEGGSRNVGVANAFHAGGLTAGLLTVCGEVSKVIVPAGSAMYLFPGNTVVMLAFILSSFIGTNFSLFLKGKGGLGATIELWTLLFFSPYSALTLGTLFLVVYGISKNTYYTVMTTQIFLPIVLLILERSVAWAAFGTVILIVFLLKYRPDRDDFAYWRWGPRGLERR